ncbi:DinB family protein [Chloroflexota bacterium]
MNTKKEVNSLLATLDKTVSDVLAYFNGPGSTSKARVGEWGAWEVLCHFVLWHEATIKGMKSVACSGEPYLIDGATDELNAGAVAKYQGKSFNDLTARLRQLQEELKQAARSLPDPDAPVMTRKGGTTLSGRERLEIINGHWLRHMEALQAAEPC